MPIKIEDQLCFAVYAAAHAFTRAYRPHLEKLGLTYPQYLVMLALWQRDHQPVKDIGQALDLDSGTLSPLLKRLEQAGFIERHRSPADERQVIVSLSDKGRALQPVSEEIHAAIGAATGCSAAELQDLREALTGLKAALATET